MVMELENLNFKLVLLCNKEI